MGPGQSVNRRPCNQPGVSQVWLGVKDSSVTGRYFGGFDELPSTVKTWSPSAALLWSKQRSPPSWTGAPCSPQRTWAEKAGAQPLRTLLLSEQKAVGAVKTKSGLK